MHCPVSTPYTFDKYYPLLQLVQEIVKEVVQVKHDLSQISHVNELGE